MFLHWLYALSTISRDFTGLFLKMTFTSFIRKQIHRAPQTIMAGRGSSWWVFFVRNWLWNSKVQIRESIFIIPGQKSEKVIQRSWMGGHTYSLLSQQSDSVLPHYFQSFDTLAKHLKQKMESEMKFKLFYFELLWGIHPGLWYNSALLVRFYARSKLDVHFKAIGGFW